MELTIKTEGKRQIVDVTDEVSAQLHPDTHVVVLTVLHTTAALTTADLDPGTDLDLLDFLDAITPKLSWRHPHDPAHAPSHLLSSVIGPSLALSVRDGQLVQGTWQRIILVELDGPRDRQVSLTLLSA